MASRKEEKEARRAERIALEQAHAAAAARKQRLMIGGGVLLAIVAIAAVVVLVAAGGSGHDGPGETGVEADTSVSIPARQITDLDEAAQKAGCVVRTFPSEGRTHLASDTATNPDYKTNPPTSGNHRPTPADDGIYSAGNEPDPENWVHTLEHGRILYQYAPGTSERRVKQLQTLFAEPFRGVAGYHQVVMQNNTDMPFAVAGVAWRHYVGCEKFTDATFDALRAFRDRYVDKGPEIIP